MQRHHVDEAALQRRPADVDAAAFCQSAFSPCAVCSCLNYGNSPGRSISTCLCAGIKPVSTM